MERIGGIDISIKKAFTSSAFDIATKDLGELAQPGEDFYGIHARRTTAKSWSSRDAFRSNERVISEAIVLL